MKIKSLFLVLFVFLLGAAFATTVIPLSVEELVQISSHIIEGRAVQSWSQWDANHNFILTYTKFQVQHTLKGQVGQEIIVRQLGGTVDGITQTVSGIHHWRVGEQAVLFLRPGRIMDGSLEVTGLVQGNFLVRTGPNGEKLVSNGVPGVSSLKPGASMATQYRGSAMRMQDLESRVQKVVQQ